MFDPIRIDDARQGLGSLYPATRPRSAISAEAESARFQAERAMVAIERSQSLYGSKAAAIAEIWAIFNECREEDWDGYGGRATDRRSAERSIALVRALPTNVPVPQFAAEPDGSIALEWYVSNGVLLTLSASPAGALPYAWLDGNERGHAIADFEDGTFPSRVLRELRILLSRFDAPVRTA